jgi:hypothetical protein
MEHQADVYPQLRLIRPGAGPGCEKNGRSATWAVTTRSGRHQVPVAVLPTAKSLSAFSLKPQSDRLLVINMEQRFGVGMSQQTGIVRKAFDTSGNSLLFCARVIP